MLIHKAAAHSSSLDLPLCDFDAMDFLAIGKAIGERKGKGKDDGVFQELLFCGNYRMGLDGVLALLETCLFKVQSLDLSCCDLSEAMTCELLQRLVVLGRRQLRRCRELSSPRQYQQEQQGEDQALVYRSVELSYVS